MYTTVLLFILLAFVNQINGRTFQLRQSDSLDIMREKCAQNPYAEECTRIKQQMEDLLRKCNDMITQVSACDDVRGKYCYIWPKELFCYGSNGGGGQVTAKPPTWDNDPDWYQIPSDSNELKSRGDYCVSHQSESKCQNLLRALKVRYEECAKRPKTDVSCQNFKVALCAAFPNFSPCLNGGSGFKRTLTQLRRALRTRREVSTS